MKKLIISIIIAVFPLNTLAITPGYGGDITCQVWREGTVESKVWCDDKRDVFKRTYELEVLTEELQQQIQSLQQKVNIQSITPVQAPAPVQTQTIIQKEIIVKDPDNARVEALEKKVSTLELAVNFIQDKVMKAITTVIDLLKKIIK